MKVIGSNLSGITPYERIPDPESGGMIVYSARNIGPGFQKLQYRLMFRPTGLAFLLMIERLFEHCRQPGISAPVTVPRHGVKT